MKGTLKSSTFKSWSYRAGTLRGVAAPSFHKVCFCAEALAMAAFSPENYGMGSAAAEAYALPSSVNDALTAPTFTETYRLPTFADESSGGCTCP